MKNRFVVVYLGCVIFCVLFFPSIGQVSAQDPTNSAAEKSARVAFERVGDNILVRLGQSHFTTYCTNEFGKPIFYPLLAPGQLGVTRNWPMRSDVKGEAHDHPHHKSVWFSHEFNGLDFWTESEGEVKVIATEFGVKSLKANQLKTVSQWVTKKNQKPVFEDQTVYSFGGDLHSRWLEAKITFKAKYGDLSLDDTKEGVFAIRTHPDIRLSPRPKQGVNQVFGKAFNSAGDVGKDLWGRKAAWVVYQGPIEGNDVSIAIFDHVDNLRHPTTWHARDYGLIAANPFGLHHFQKQPQGAGAVVIEKGKSLTLNYRLQIFEGLIDEQQASEVFQEFVKN